MKINSKEIVSSKEWLCREILNSIPHEVIKKAKDAGVEDYEIKLVINGVECEPKLLNHMLNKYEEIVDREAKAISAKEIERIEGEIRDKAKVLEEAMSEAHKKIISGYKIEQD